MSVIAVNKPAPINLFSLSHTVSKICFYQVSQNGIDFSYSAVSEFRLSFQLLLIDFLSFIFSSVEK
jgi:hypothetical protein